MDSKKIGATIAMLRGSKNMTQAELGERIGVSFQAVSKWERGETLPDIAILPTLADIFETLRIDKQRSGFTVAKGAQVVTTIIVVALVAVAIIVIVRLIASFVTDFKNRDNDVREFVKIKRRKF